MFKKLALVPLLAVGFSAFLSAEKVALLVGVSDFSDSRYNLSGIDKDINKMKKLLKKKGFDRIEVLYNEKATRENVISALKKYSNLGEDDSLVIYFSTHGVQVPDLNGDEKDKKDEAYVLSNTKINSRGQVVSLEGLLVDDEIERLLVPIKAKKLILSDSCHSGSMYKSLDFNVQPKFLTISPELEHQIQSSKVTTKSILGEIAHPKDIVSLGASTDDQTSMATTDGSLFTDGVTDTLIKKPNVTFIELRDNTERHIRENCSRINFPPHKPTLYSDKEKYKRQPVNHYLNITVTINKKIPTLIEDYLDDLLRSGNVDRINIQPTKQVYKAGDRVNFEIDTEGKAGYLYILSIKDQDNTIDVLFPNAYYKKRGKVKGHFIFPGSKAPFKFTATTEGDRERTVVYAILSDQEIPFLEEARNLDGENFKSVSKKFIEEVKLKSSIKDILIRKRDNTISLGKTIFFVEE